MISLNQHSLLEEEIERTDFASYLSILLSYLIDLRLDENLLLYHPRPVVLTLIYPCRRFCSDLDSDPILPLMRFREKRR